MESYVFNFVVLIEKCPQNRGHDERGSANIWISLKVFFHSYFMGKSTKHIKHNLNLKYFSAYLTYLCPISKAQSLTVFTIMFAKLVIISSKFI